MTCATCGCQPCCCQGPQGPRGPQGLPGLRGPPGPPGDFVQPGGSTSSLVLIIGASVGFIPISDASFVPGDDNFQFTHLNGALTYVGTAPRRFHVYGQLAGISSDPGVSVSLGLMRNGVEVNVSRSAGFETFNNNDTHQVCTGDWVLLNPGDVMQLSSRTDGVAEITGVNATLVIG